MMRELVLRAQSGDHEAFERLAAANVRQLHGTAVLILRDREAARDAVQETLIETWRSLPTLREPDAFGGWLHQILVRSCQRAVRTRSRRVIEVAHIDTDAPAPSTEHLVDDRDQIARAFRRLTQEQRTVLVLHHHVGMPLAESAAVLDIPVGTMKSRLSRATEALRAAIAADERDAVAPQGRSA